MLASPLPTVTPPAPPATPNKTATAAPAAPADGPDSFAHALDQADKARQPEKAHATRPAARPATAKAAPKEEPGKPATTSATPTDPPPTDGPAPTSATAEDQDQAATTPGDAAALLASLPPLPNKPYPPAAPLPGGTRSDGVRNPGLPGDERNPALQAQPLAGKAGELTGTAQAAESFASALREQTAPAGEAKPAEAAPPLPPALAAPAATTVAASAPVEARIAASPGSADFPSQLGVQLSTFVREGIQHAKLELHPVELGPVTVQIQLDGNNAQVNLAAEQAPTRHALEQALPALAGSLREAGLTLSGGGVFEQPRQPAPEQALPTSSRGSRDSGTDSAPLPATSAPRRRGVVDLVA